MQTIRPEMSGRIIDDSHYNFHVVCKAKIVHALNKLKSGKDFLSTLSKLSFSTEKKWTANTSKNPNVAILLEIVEEYKKHEHRPSRAKVLVPILEYAIGLYASDLFYVERGEWFLYQICKRTNDFQFHSCFINPDNWYPKARARPDMFEAENAPDAPDINQEYVKWYGVDPTVENCVISYDMKKKEELITSQKAAYEQNRLWAKAELEKI